MVSGNAASNQAAGSQPEGQLLQACLACLAQCEAVLLQLSTADYCHREQGAASIGAHMRHILDRFQCFLAGLDDCIDYDARQRDPGMETSLETARFALASMRRRLAQTQADCDAGRRVTMRERVDPDAPSLAVPTTVAREMVALVSHSIHHLAIIAVLMKARDYQVPASLGKAPSTLVHEQG